MQNKPIPIYSIPCRQTQNHITRNEAARLLRWHRNRGTVIRLLSGHRYCATATQWINWDLDTRPGR